MSTPAPAFNTNDGFDLNDIPAASTPNTIAREATRWIFFAGDLITPASKRFNDRLKHGGENFAQELKTLVRTKGFLKRCLITPMEIGFDFLNDDLMGGEVGESVGLVIDSGGGNALAKNLHPVRVYPGDEIKSLLRERSSENFKGITELTPLVGLDFQAVKDAGIQQFIFPEWDKIMLGVQELPIKLSEIQSCLASRQAATADDDIRTIIDQMLEACDSFRLWGKNYLSQATQLVKTPIHNGHLFTYSPQAEMLFEQLEIRREDLIRPEQDIADIVNQINSGNNVSSGEMQSVIALLAQNIALLTKNSINNGVESGVEVETIPEIEVESRVTCSAMRSNGEPCKGFPVSNGKCRVHVEK